MASVYTITNLINDHKYVGKTERKPEERWKEHIYLSKYDPEKMTISTAINKHGKENFKFEYCSTRLFCILKLFIFK